MIPFHICVHARPAHVSTGESVVLEGRSLATLAIRPDALRMPLGVSFEDATESLARLPRMFIEPDGSFVWVSEHAASPLQIEGCLYDRDGKLLYVELKGACPRGELERLLRAFGWSATPFVFQLMRQAVYLDEEAFWQFLKYSQATLGP